CSIACARASPACRQNPKKPRRTGAVPAQTEHSKVEQRSEGALVMAVSAPDIKAIFVAALDLASGTERAAYLNRACAGSPDVRLRVEALLSANGKAGNFLESPALATMTAPDPGAGPEFPTLSAEADPAAAPAVHEFPPLPRRLGDFELVRRLGEG